ncbi:hypothetical protein CFIMG_003322RAa [Ceratocystis fimbriata CBS 114723]|uniref:Uncharacterized protein n=1 Tax=Ceratocystis fimbriata CBS 114723 TaxID=1035309 RepID=A0A2C5WY69_9PEZI|nr:hypothetical protein CFIMG_003322RAa [Ceratocystis fimbriata CBS 114723]
MSSFESLEVEFDPSSRPGFMPSSPSSSGLAPNDGAAVAISSDHQVASPIEIKELHPDQAWELSSLDEGRGLRRVGYQPGDKVEEEKKPRDMQRLCLWLQLQL